MSTIWEFLVERLKQCCEGSVTTETRGAQLATGFLASHLALRILTKVLKSLRLPFLRIQEAIMTIVSARAGMARTIMPILRGGTSASPMEGYKTSAEIAGKSRAARSARSKQTTVVLSLSVAGEISRVAGAHAAAAYSVLLPTLWRHDVRTVGGASLAAELPEATYHVRTARPSHSERDVKEKREAMTKAYPFAQNTIMGIGGGSATSDGSSIVATITESIKSSATKNATAAGAVSRVIAPSHFLATAALLGIQGIAALTQLSTRMPSIFSLLPNVWKSALQTNSLSGEIGTKESMETGRLEATLVHSLERTALRPGAPLLGMYRARAKGIPLDSGRKLFEKLAEGAQIGIREKETRGTRSLGKHELQRKFPAGGPVVTNEGEGPPLEGGVLALNKGIIQVAEELPGITIPYEGSFARGVLFFPSLALRKMELHRSALIWNGVNSAVYPALLSLSIIQHTLESRLARIEADTEVTERNAKTEASAVVANRFPGFSEVTTPSGAFLLGALDISALAAEVSGSTILPPAVMTPLIRAERALSHKEFGGGEERLPVPMELEEPKVYPASNGLRVELKLEGEGDLWDLRRKISRILEDEMRRHYGEG